MRFIRYILLLSGLLVTAAGCRNDKVFNGPDDREVKLTIQVRTPGVNYRTRAVDEGAVDEVTVFVFDETGGEYVLEYIVPGYSLQASSGQADYEFVVRLVPSADPLKLWLVANAGAAVGTASAGMTEDEVKEAVTMAFASSGFTDVLPMTGEVELASLTVDATIDDAVLVRSAARVDVVNNATDFTLTSVRIFRANDLLQVIPDDLTGNSVTSPSVPAGSTLSVNSATFTATANTLVQQIYIPESDIPAVGDRRLGATSVVVGGLYNGSSQTTYYRMDFIPNNAGGQPNESLFGQVLRNHLYRFEIQDVLAPGWSTDEEASLYPSTDVDVVIQAWDEETMYMEFDDYDYFGVSARSVTLGYYAGAGRSILIQTSLATYQAYWGNADGTIITGAGPIVPGGDRDDPRGLFNAEISADGSSISFTTLAPYDPATAATRYLVLVAGRFRIVISVVQGLTDYRGRSVDIIGSTREIGSFGDYRAGVGNPISIAGERARGLNNMLLGNTNFGPTGTVSLDEMYISGLNLGNSMPRKGYEEFDVLYLTYALNPPQADVNDILDWLDEDEHRMLIVQFDNAATNSNMMSALGFSSLSFGGTTVAYSYAATDAPDFVQFGPFGTPGGVFSYKCRDDTYGSILPSLADGLGYIPILLSNGGAGTTGNYVMAVNPERRVIVCGDCDIYSNVNSGSAGYYLSLNDANYTIDPANPAHVMMGNLWAWIADIVLQE